MAREYVSGKGKSWIRKTNDSLAETALRFALASMLFEFDFETCPESDVSSIQDLENDFNRPWRQKLMLQFNPRLEKTEDIPGFDVLEM